ncbi:MAG: Rrf2 family transcriptional regulator [Deltaproteobacteria bacterium]|nr:Rrf2 family transcriptional regulator [Deltaproteobacteria bacterium]
MKINTKSRYSVRIMTYLADHASVEKPVSLNEISKKQKISQRYLEQLIVPLKISGLVKSVSGKYGGHYLNRKPSAVSLYDIIVASSGEIKLIDCVKNPNSCEFYKKCNAREIWELVNTHIVDILKDFTLEDLSQKKLKLKRHSKIGKWLKVRC